MDAEVVAHSRPGRPLVVLVLGFLVAVFLGRLIVTNQAWGWALFVLLLPPVLFILASRIRWVPALVATGLFSLAVLSISAFVRATNVGWGPLLLLPVIVATLALMVKVWREMRFLEASRKEL